MLACLLLASFEVASITGSLNGLLTPSQTAATSSSSGAFFDRIIVVPLENTYMKDVRA